MRVLVVSKDFPAPGQPEDGIAVLRQAWCTCCNGSRYHGRARRAACSSRNAHVAQVSRRPLYRYSIEGIPVRILRAFFPPRMIAMEYLPFQIGGPLGRLVRDFAPDLIHGHCLIPSGQLAVRFGVPSLITAHGSDAMTGPGAVPAFSVLQPKALLKPTQ